MSRLKIREMPSLRTMIKKVGKKFDLPSNFTKKVDDLIKITIRRSCRDKKHVFAAAIFVIARLEKIPILFEDLVDMFDVQKPLLHSYMKKHIRRAKIHLLPLKSKLLLERYAEEMNLTKKLKIMKKILKKLPKNMGSPKAKVLSICFCFKDRYGVEAFCKKFNMSAFTIRKYYQKIKKAYPRIRRWRI